MTAGQRQTDLHMYEFECDYTYIYKYM